MSLTYKHASIHSRSSPAHRIHSVDLQTILTALSNITTQTKKTGKYGCSLFTCHSSDQRSHVPSQGLATLHTAATLRTEPTSQHPISRLPKCVVCLRGNSTRGHPRWSRVRRDPPDPVVGGNGTPARTRSRDLGTTRWSWRVQRRSDSSARWAGPP